MYSLINLGFTRASQTRATGALIVVEALANSPLSIASGSASFVPGPHDRYWGQTTVFIGALSRVDAAENRGLSPLSKCRFPGTVSKDRQSCSQSPGLNDGDRPRQENSWKRTSSAFHSPNLAWHTTCNSHLESGG